MGDSISRRQCTHFCSCAAAPGALCASLHAHVQDNYKPYAGDGSFLAGPTARTKALWSKLEKLICEEIKKVREGV